MKAVVRDRYGPPNVLEVRELVEPPVGDDDVLVRVRAASVNPADWYTLTGPLVARIPNGLRRPKNNRLGTDFAGTVEAVGKDVTRFRPGDDVFGARTGALAEYVSVPEDRALAAKPANITFEEAASIPIAATTALQGLRDKAQLQAGQRILINGASGGVGTFAVQIAKSFGAHVTAVCSTRNVELARSLGADRIIDYTQEDFTRGGERFDVLFDVAGSRTWSEYRRVLGPKATFVVVGAPKSHPARQIARILLAGRLRGNQKVTFFVAKLTRADLDVLSEMLASGTLRAVVERCYDLSDTADAFRYLGDGHAQGKIVVTLAA